jgi:hypothetical protein
LNTSQEQYSSYGFPSWFYRERGREKLGNGFLKGKFEAGKNGRDKASKFKLRHGAGLTSMGMRPSTVFVRRRVKSINRNILIRFII